MIRRFRRWWSKPVAWPPSPWIVVLAAAFCLAGLSVGAWFASYAVETGNEHVLPIILVFLIAGAADLVRRAWRSGKPR
ncbi:MAG TPA: hypothetical protein VIP77_15480 [Jiangellaceae bacterium]